VLSRVEELVGQARRMKATRDPGTAFFEFFEFMVGQAEANHVQRAQA
jgi:hypothetical protein